MVIAEPPGHRAASSPSSGQPLLPWFDPAAGMSMTQPALPLLRALSKRLHVVSQREDRLLACVKSARIPQEAEPPGAVCLWCEHCGCGSELVTVYARCDVCEAANLAANTVPVGDVVMRKKKKAAQSKDAAAPEAAPRRRPIFFCVRCAMEHSKWHAALGKPGVVVALRKPGNLQQTLRDFDGLVREAAGRPEAGSAPEPELSPRLVGSVLGVLSRLKDRELTRTGSAETPSTTAAKAATAGLEAFLQSIRGDA